MRTQRFLWPDNDDISRIGPGSGDISGFAGGDGGGCCINKLPSLAGIAHA